MTTVFIFKNQAQKTLYLTISPAPIRAGLILGFWLLANVLFNLSGLNAVAFEQRIDGRFATAEADVEVHSPFSASALQDVLAETFGCFLIEDRTVLLLRLFEDGEGVCVKQFRPFIAVVPGCVSSGEDMRERTAHLRSRYGR